MSYSKAMPNIKPYPLHQENTYDMSNHHRQHHQQAHYSVYRPAYHRIPSTPAIAPRKEVWATNMSPEVSPIVPSMSAASIEFYQSAVAASNFSYQQQYYRQPVVPSNSNYHHHQHHTQIVTTSHNNNLHIPIHHTLENATITYDTVEQDFQKDLVKDVFFSPAMIHHGREMSPSTDSSSSASSTCAQSDNEESDDVSVVTPPQFSTPSDLLLLDTHLFDFGLDLATASSTSNQTTTSSYEEVMMMAAAAANKKKPAFTLSLKNKFDLANQTDLLPTPPADYIVPQNKRRCSDSVLQNRINKKQRLNMNSAAHLRSFHTNTPPASPMLSTLKHETIFESGCDYFDDASGEESSDDDEYEQSNKRSTLEYNQFSNQSTLHLNTATSEYQTPAKITLSDDSDSFSTTSWEEEEEEEEAASDIEEEQVESEEEEEEDEEFKAPIVKYTPKKYKKSVNNSSIHPLSKKKSASTELEQQPQSSGHFIEEEEDEILLLPKAPPRPTATPTIYQKLTKASVDWCRYCGTTEGVNWRPGPWGKRTLCNKHGCDYKGYGFACKLPRLDLTGFTKESIDERERPVLQLYCSGCQRKDSWQGNVLVRCEGCPKAFHQKCCPDELTDEFVASKESWFCDANCSENARRKRIVVELPRKRLPLMCAPKSSSSASSVCSESSSSTSRPRRESSISSTK